jgi:hypothetical protein
MSAPAPAQQQAPSPPSPFVEDDSKPPLDDLVRAHTRLGNTHGFFVR